MRSWNAIREITVALAASGLLMPPSVVVAQAPTTTEISTSQVADAAARDVALDDDGFLHGVVVNDAGNVQADVLIYAVSDGVVVSTTSSDVNGVFRIEVARGGLYHLLVGNRAVMLRCWAGRSAPPSATPQLLVAVDDVYRGQISPASCGLGSPWVLAGLVTAAIVIPVALHNNRSDRPNGSE